MKKLEFLFLIVVFTLPLAAQDTAPDQTAPSQTPPSQQKATWKDRWSKLKSTSGLLPTPQNNTSDCPAPALFGLGECSIMVNGNRDNLAWERNADSMQRVFYTTRATSGQGRGGSVDYLGQVKGQDTYYLRSSDGNSTYKVEGTIKDARVTEIKGDAPTGLVGGSQAADEAQAEDMDTNVSPVTPMGAARVGGKATATIDGEDQVVTIDQMDDHGRVTLIHGKQNVSYRVAGSKLIATGTSQGQAPKP